MKFLRTKLFLGYFGSLLILTAFFYVVVHIFAIPNSTEYLFVILTILGGVGFFAVFKIYDLLNKLQEALNREQRFIADVAHELKTPLATLRTSLELAKVNDPIAEIDHLSNTLKDVLELAWSESTFRQSPKIFNLSVLVEELLEITTKMSLNKKISISSEIDQDILIVGFREKLARAILNIIDNAIKYSQDLGKVEISLEKRNDQALIIIKDNGIGISKKEIPHIFDRFYRGSKTSKVLGSGLGLAIASSIITTHQGSINIDSELGKGTTVTIRLPIT